MILGILSDTHGQRLRTATAIRLLQQVGAEAFVHCGDVGGAGVLTELVGLQIWLVSGNSDGPDSSLERYTESVGLTVAREVPLRLELGGRSIVVFHGHEAQFAHFCSRMLESGGRGPEMGKWDYVLHGHTHVPRDQRIGSVRIINPGALHRAPSYTVATLDLSSDTLKFWQVLDDASQTPPTQWYLYQ